MSSFRIILEPKTNFQQILTPNPNKHGPIRNLERNADGPKCNTSFQIPHLSQITKTGLQGCLGHEPSGLGFGATAIACALLHALCYARLQALRVNSGAMQTTQSRRIPLGKRRRSFLETTESRVVVRKLNRSSLEFGYATEFDLVPWKSQVAMRAVGTLPTHSLESYAHGEKRPAGDRPKKRGEPNRL